MPRKMNVGIVTFPLLKSGTSPLSNLVHIIESFADNIFIISGNSAGLIDFGKKSNIYLHLVKHSIGQNTFSRIARFIYTQLKLSIQLAKVTNHVDKWLVFLGEGGLLFPLLTIKLFRKKAVLVMAANDLEIAKYTRDPLRFPLGLLEKFTFRIANELVVYSPNLIKEWKLQQYQNKISIAREHNIDFDKFKTTTMLDDRKFLVGFIGRLSEEKGILNFVEAIPGTLKERNEINFLIIGDGCLRDKIERELNEHDLADKVKIMGWISHDDLPKYLNELKLIILPSYTEGLPNVMIEAMACGTPVLASPVGAIPDFIQNEVTGFILENNSPDCITTNILNTLSHPNLKQIAYNSRILVEQEFNVEKNVDRYRNILGANQAGNGVN